MWWIIGLYIIPGMITTWLMPKFVEYNGGQEVLKATLEEYKEEYWEYLLGFISFCPILNLLSAILLIYWYITCTLKS